MGNEQIKPKFKLKNVIIILLVIVFGFIAGIGGEFFGRIYLSNFSFFRDFYFTEPANVNQGEIVISQPRKVVVEQNLRLNQIKNDVQGAVMSIYRGKNSAKNILDKIYLPDDYLGQAVVLTSDGWLMAVNNSAVLANESVVITPDQKVYKVEKVVEDLATRIMFIKIQAQNLAVIKLGDTSQLNDGEQLVGFNNYFDALNLVEVINKNYKKINNKFDFVSSTQIFDKYILLSSNSISKGTPLFNFQSELVGFQSGQSETLNQSIPINYIIPVINQVLKGQTIKRPYLGISYIDLSKVTGLAELDRQKQNTGAMIWPDENGIAIASDSPLIDKLVKGDIITGVENQAVDSNNDLTNLILEYNSGQEIKIKYLHDQKELEVNVVLK